MTNQRYANERVSGEYTPGHPHLCRTIQRLATLADDDQLDVCTPARVADALQNHGALLAAYEIDDLRQWLEEQEPPPPPLPLPPTTEPERAEMTESIAAITSIPSWYLETFKIVQNIDGSLRKVEIELRSAIELETLDVRVRAEMERVLDTLHSIKGSLVLVDMTAREVLDQMLGDFPGARQAKQFVKL